MAADQATTGPLAQQQYRADLAAGEAAHCAYCCRRIVLMGGRWVDMAANLWCWRGNGGRRHTPSEERYR